MLLSNSPTKLVLPVAQNGSKRTIPVAASPTPGVASFDQGFPVQTSLPVTAGGVPPDWLDMNGLMYQTSNVIRYLNAGAGFVFDSAFANDANIGGYPKGARVLRTDGTGYWLSTVDNNTTDPEGVSAAGWSPDYVSGAASIVMTSSNYTLSAAESGKQIIIVTGLLTANLNLIFPNLIGKWVVINRTTGNFAITCKTSAGTGVVVLVASVVTGDGVNIYGVSDYQPSVTTTGSSPSFTAADGQVTALRTGAQLSVLFNAASSSATLNFNSFGAVALKQYDNTGAKIDAQVAVSMRSRVVYDGTDWVVLDPLPAAVPLAVPSGTVIWVASSTSPAGYLKANGALVSRTTYADLFATIGTVFGVGDGSTTFGLPDLRGEFLRGWDDGRGVDAGRVFGSGQADDFKAHTHTTSTGGTTSNSLNSGGSVNLAASTTGSTGGAETRPRNVALLACIKY